jgi:prepilin-type N-terminal cleavage/methylation domain-containing protein
MTSSSHNVRSRQDLRRPRTGFTLVELMAVIGIILVLMAILIPSITRAVRQAQRTRMQYDLQAIASALDAYKKDHHDYPAVPPGSGLGANILARALIAPAPDVAGKGDLDFDGAEGPGFRTRVAISGVQQGKVWGPYLPADRFRTQQIPIPPGTNQLHWVIMDMKDVPILYFPAHRGANIHAPNGYVAAGGATPPAMFELGDNYDLTKKSGYYPDVSGFPSPNDAAGTDLNDWLADFRVLMGANPADGSAADPLAAGAPFVLWSAGPDQLWGSRNHVYDPTTNQRIPMGPKNPSDDVSNIVR